MAVYGDLPTAAGRPAVRLNVIASVDGATTLAGVSGGLGGRADHALFAVLRSLADVVLVAAGTVRAERYGPSASRGLWSPAGRRLDGTPGSSRRRSPARSW
jgi:riboflavin biosynthesis pyrimidine reductase